MSRTVRLILSPTLLLVAASTVIAAAAPATASTNIATAAAATADTIITTVTAPTDCSCGYMLNSSILFTEALETDFLHLYDDSDLRDNPCWTPQAFNVTPVAARGPYGQSATLSNVVVNPLESYHNWSGPGIHGGDAGLQLWVRSVLIASNLITMGEIASNRSDMLYGSFRIGMKLTAVPGTCTGFFYYRSNSQEIDMEFLSSAYNSTSNPVDMTMQTEDSARTGYNTEGTQTYKVGELPWAPYEQVHEYRFDWIQSGTSFFADGNWVDDLMYAYPGDPGSLVTNHWSNGNPLWSQGPPDQDAVVTIQYIKAYFNSSDPAAQQQYSERCPVGTASSSNTCALPMTPGASEDGWFRRGMCGERISATTVSPSSTTPSSSEPTKSKSAASASASGSFEAGMSVLKCTASSL